MAPVLRDVWQMECDADNIADSKTMGAGDIA